ncbi:nicotinamide phosphoribosyltransferase domain-containing protein [Pseudonocardia sp. T1-2H]
MTDTDNDKHCHYPLYPKGTEYVSSYIEPEHVLQPVFRDGKLLRK